MLAFLLTRPEHDHALQTNSGHFWVLHHHEWYDGSGYPHGLREDEIPLAARILAVADVYDALTSERPYRSALSEDEALAHLQRMAGTQFEGGVVEAFARIEPAWRKRRRQAANESTG